jgi:hypothetical protein
MKYIFLVIGLITVLAFSTTEEKNLASVSQISGFYIFVDSKPVAEYDNLGTVKARVGITGIGYTEIRDKLLDKAKKQYPYGNGVILRMGPSGSQSYADVLKFK